MSEQDASGNEEITVRQVPGERLALDTGGVAVYGDDCQPALRHRIDGQVLHGTASGQPLVHMVCWDEDRPCELSGQVALVGSDEAPPIRVRMSHEFQNPLDQLHRIEPVDHTLHVDSQLAKPIHHALQMRTPLQLRFCNAWHLASDYSVEIRLWDNRVLSLRLSGATIASPQPCADDAPCAEPATRPGFA